MKNEIQDINPFRYLLSITLVTVLLLVSLLIGASPVQATTLFNDDFEGSLASWATTTGWTLNTAQYHGGSQSANATGTATLVSSNVNLSSASSATLTFWFRLDGVDDDDCLLYFWNGSSYDLIADLYEEADIIHNNVHFGEGTWVHFSTFIDLDEYNISTFNFKIGTALAAGEEIWIDDVVLNAPAEATWPQFQRDEINSGYSITFTGPTSDNVVRAWSDNLVGGPWNGIDTASVVAGGVVYTISSAGHVYAHDAGNGSERWHTSLGNTATYTFELSTPAYGDGHLFVAQNDGDVFSLDAATGDIEWSVDATESDTDQINTPVLYDDDGFIYFGTWHNGTYYCLDVDGNGEWVFEEGAGYYWAGACLIGDYIVFGDEDGTLFSLDKSDGEEANDDISVASAQIRSSVTWDPVTECVYFTCKDGYLWGVEFDASTGDFGGITLQVLLDGGVQSTCTPVVKNGRVYVGTGQFNGGAFHCASVSDNTTTIWDWDDSGNLGGVQSSAAVCVASSDVYIYFTTNDDEGKVYCLKDGVSTPTLVWEYTPDYYSESGTYAGYILQGVAVYDGKVYFGNDGAYLYGLIDGDD